MRYAHGIAFSALLSGIIFNGAAVIKMMGYGLTDFAALQGIWLMYTIWSVISLVILVLPILIVYFRRREILKEVIVFEIGGLAFFSPLWLLLDIELTGDPVYEVLLLGFQNALPIVGLGGQIVGLNLGPIIIIPLLIGSFLLGVFLLRPSFVNRFSETEMADYDDIVVRGVDKEPSKEMHDLPDVSQPTPDEASLDEMRTTLKQIGMSESAIQSVIDAGLTGVTDLLSSSPKTIARSVGIEESQAEEMLVKLQKQVWGARV
ncbi:MAG: hypothetical protein GF309_05695 [Candidatus Lokiarchaeota archaeon]|nr:hypothetical protein [Candidatus Lokiarchaeota archaeon]